MFNKILVYLGLTEEAELERLIGFFGNMVSKLEAYQTKLEARVAARQAKIDTLQGEVENLTDLSAQAKKAADNIKKIVQ